LSDLPEELYQKLYPFQKKGVEFGIRNFGRVLIGDEMVYFCFEELFKLI